VTNLKIGIQTLSLRQPLRKAIATAARLGADGVEIDARTELRPGELSQTGLREFRKLLDDYRLKVSAVAFPTRRGYEEQDDLERRILATQAAMRMAYELGANVVVNQLGSVPTSADDTSFTRLVEALTSLGAYGERIGARLAAIPANESPTDLARLLAALPDATMGVDFHPVAILQSGHSTADALDDLGRHVLHVHACDAVPVSGGGRVNEVDLGRGLADLPGLIARLTAQFNYCGWITVERREATDPITSIENAVAFLRSL